MHSFGMYCCFFFLILAEILFFPFIHPSIFLFLSPTDKPRVIRPTSHQSSGMLACALLDHLFCIRCFCCSTSVLRVFTLRCVFLSDQSHTLAHTENK